MRKARWTVLAYTVLAGGFLSGDVVIKKGALPTGPTYAQPSKVEITDFTVSPPSGAIIHNTMATLKATIRNSGGSEAKNVKVVFDRSGRQFSAADAAGDFNTQEIASLPAGQSRELTATWQAKRGIFDVGVALTRVPANDTASNAARTKGLIIEVKPLLVEKKLNWATTLNYGPQGSGVVHSGSCPGGYAVAPGPNATFTVMCGDNQSMDITYTRYTTFQLRNGWKVKSYSPTNPPSTDEAKFQWVQPPQIGSTSPTMKARLTVKENRTLSVPVEITIEGPVDLEPYQ